MQNKILIITNTIDYHADAIIKEINQLGENLFFRLNTDYFHMNYEFKIEFNNHSFLIKNKINGFSICSKEIKTVWWRRPEDLNFENSDIPKHLHSFTDDEYYMVLKGLIAILETDINVKIVSHPIDIIRAKDKIRQQILASELSLLTPSQIITNSNAFFTEQNWKNNAIVKPIDSTNDIIDENGNEYVSYTKELNDDLLNKIVSKELKLSIHYFQEKIKPEFEVRATFFDNKLYPFMIKGNYNVDWRQIDPSKISFTYFKDFPFIKECITFANRLNLKYGAFDFIYNGDFYYFLECNPNGQFLFCDINGEFGLAKKFAKFLNE
ncbi:MAG: hypothetical protein IPM47_17680 [Sphingobacteriales bacterium]|nr:MAG: hypothetical protein IPM47_17680 [Sphingobacteriales bacterium]